MRGIYLQSIGAFAALLILSGVTQAALIDRGGGFIYDDFLDITWTQNANINSFGNWDDQMAWADSLSLFDSVRNATWDDWRLPTTLQPDASCGTQNDPGGGFPLQSYGFDCTGSEMGHLFNVDGISVATPGSFTNLSSGIWWSSTEYAPLTTSAFRINQDGITGVSGKSSGLYAWAVRDGDVGLAPVPVPAAAWLFGSAIGLLGWMRRKRSLKTNTGGDLL